MDPTCVICMIIYLKYKHELFYMSAAYTCLDSKIAKSTMLRTISRVFTIPLMLVEVLRARVPSSDSYIYGYILFKSTGL